MMAVTSPAQNWPWRSFRRLRRPRSAKGFLPARGAATVKNRLSYLMVKGATPLIVIVASSAGACELAGSCPSSLPAAACCIVRGRRCSPSSRSGKEDGHTAMQRSETIYG